MLYRIHVDRIYPLTQEEMTAAITLLKKWRSSIFSQTATDKIKVIALINRAYNYLGWSEAPVIFADGVGHTAKIIEVEFPNRSGDYVSSINFDNYQQVLRRIQELTLGKKADDTSEEYIKEYIDLETRHLGIDEILGRESDLFNYSYDWIYEPLEYLMAEIIHKVLDLDLLFVNNSNLQYFIERLNLTHEPEGWNILANLTQECPFLIPLTKFCLVIDRPKEIHLDREQLPHANDRAAMKFRDRTKVYFHHGIPIPAKYGKISRHRWKPKWLLFEHHPDYRNILTFVIGYKKFRKALLHTRYDFWQDRYELIDKSIDIIICWQLYHLEGLYLKDYKTGKLCLNDEEVKELIKYLPIELPIELYCLYQYYNGGYQLCPSLKFYPLERAIYDLSNLRWLRSPESGYPFPLFKGDQQEIYFITVSNRKTDSARVYCQCPGMEAVLYSECITSLIVTIAQCYQEDAYEVTIDTVSERQDISADLSTIELIFDKFNPDTIDSWRAIQAI
jgi:hypothetical protein